MSQSTHYPDILGHITNNERQNIGVLQAALAVHPFAVRAGHSFEVHVLLQNASDVPVEARLHLNLPETDKKGRRKRFVAKRRHIAIEMQPAEVGCAILPATCLPDTALGSGYPISVELALKAEGNPNRVRQTEGGVAVDLERLPEEKRQQIDTLTPLSFTASGRRGLRSRVLEATLNVMPGGIAKVPELQPRWINLWSLADHMGDQMLVEQHRDVLVEKMLPKLRRETMFKPLLHETQRRFTQAGYDIDNMEAMFITKLLTLILEYAEADATGHGPIAAGDLNLVTLLKRNTQTDPDNVPEWFHGMLQLVQQKPDAAAFPEKVIPNMLYTDLIKDAVRRGFSMAQNATGVELGSPAEITAHIDLLVERLDGKSDKSLSTTDVYIPLVLAGIVAFDRVSFETEHIDAMLINMLHVMMARKRQSSDEMEHKVFEMGEQLIERALAKYGGVRRA
jgi:hypothetical protein